MHEGPVVDEGPVQSGSTRKWKHRSGAYRPLPGAYCPLPQCIYTPGF